MDALYYEGLTQTTMKFESSLILTSTLSQMPRKVISRIYRQAPDMACRICVLLIRFANG